MKCLFNFPVKSNHRLINNLVFCSDGVKFLIETSEERFIGIGAEVKAESLNHAPKITTNHEGIHSITVREDANKSLM